MEVNGANFLEHLTAYFIEAVAFTHLADIFIQSDIAFKVDFFVFLLFPSAC